VSEPRVAVLPSGTRSFVADAVVAGGGELVDVDDADALVWTATADPAGLNRVLHGSPGIRWVQLPWAGIEPYLGVVDDQRVWTSGKGVYAEPVAEMALALLLTGLRGLDHYVRATSWSGPQGRNLIGGRVTIVGAGGITRSLLEVTVVRRRTLPTTNEDAEDGLAGAARVVAAADLDTALSGADGVVLALALLPDTRGIIGRRQLEAMEAHAWLVNVARGAHVVTDDLVAALRGGTIGGAALDVTDPEPLPEGHPLWTLPNVIITPHVGNTPDMAEPLLAARIAENVRRFAAGDPLVGVVDPNLGY
jgi:phosphoglycerate dehydrogenase-like enzyme